MLALGESATSQSLGVVSDPGMTLLVGAGQKRDARIGNRGAL